jgi:hypothetical protein
MAVGLSALKRRPPFTPRMIPGTHLCCTMSRPQGHSADGSITSIEKFNYLIGNRTHDDPVTINSHNGQLTFHTDSHASHSDAVRRQGRTILGAKPKLLYNEIALTRKPIGTGHMCAYKFFAWNDRYYDLPEY